MLENDDNVWRRDIFECHHILVEYTYLQEDYTIISRSIINIAGLHLPHSNKLPVPDNKKLLMTINFYLGEQNAQSLMLMLDEHC